MTANPYRDARMARPMTQSALAKASGVSERTIRDLEKNRSVSAETILAIRAVLGMADDVTKEAEPPSCKPERSRPIRRPLHLVAADALILASILPCTANLAVAIGTEGRHPFDYAINVGIAVCAFSPAIIAALFRTTATAVPSKQTRMLQRWRGGFGILLTQPTLMESSSSSLSLASGMSLGVWLAFLTVPSSVILLDAALPSVFRRSKSFAGTAAAELRLISSQFSRGSRAIVRDVWTSGRDPGS